MCAISHFLENLWRLVSDQERLGSLGVSPLSISAINVSPVSISAIKESPVSISAKKCIAGVTIGYKCIAGVVDSGEQYIVGVADTSAEGNRFTKKLKVEISWHCPFFPCISRPLRTYFTYPISSWNFYSYRNWRPPPPPKPIPETLSILLLFLEILSFLLPFLEHFHLPSIPGSLHSWKLFLNPPYIPRTLFFLLPFWKFLSILLQF